jgi:hypothetical protein
VIVGAGLLLLLGLGLLVAGGLTGVTALYWGCVAACLVAAVLLVLVRRQMAGERAMAERVMAERASAARVPEPGEQRTTVLPAAGATGSHSTVESPPSQPQRAAKAREPEVRYSDPPRKSAPETAGEPPLEEVEVTDLLLVMDLRDEVLVIDEHPRYHVSGCPHLAGGSTFPLPVDEARSDGFTPCGTCSPDRHLAQRARERKK